MCRVPTCSERGACGFVRRIERIKFNPGETLWTAGVHRTHYTRPLSLPVLPLWLPSARRQPAGHNVVITSPLCVRLAAEIAGRSRRARHFPGLEVGTRRSSNYPDRAFCCISMIFRVAACTIQPCNDNNNNNNKAHASSAINNNNNNNDGKVILPLAPHGSTTARVKIVPKSVVHTSFSFRFDQVSVCKCRPPQVVGPQQ